MEHHELHISKTARYTTFGNPDKAKFFWVALHGYGQLVKYFSRNFTNLNPEDHFVICPEGFNKFYLNGLSGRVGATWMTKEDRLNDIDDYVAYLNQLYSDIVSPLLKPDSKFIVFGFSQGVATASRWIALGNHKPDIVIFWAGSFAPDLPPLQVTTSFSDIRTICCIGNQDEYISEAQLDGVKSHLSGLGIEAEWVSYTGGHTIDTAILADISNSL